MTRADKIPILEAFFRNPLDPPDMVRGSPLLQPVILGRVLFLRMAVEDVIVPLRGGAGPDVGRVEATGLDLIQVSDQDLVVDHGAIPGAGFASIIPRVRRVHPDAPTVQHRYLDDASQGYRTHLPHAARADFRNCCGTHARHHGRIASWKAITTS